MARRLNATLGPTKTREILGQAVYLFSIGGNDYIYYFIDFYSEGQSSTQSDQEQFVKAIVGNTTNGLIVRYSLLSR
ncbi:hypothetical protein CRG98_049951 [Punica granatum]|uniref:Uncharacterized protein n=1 Tax=Punica granatum TaxID=22663 RepID=A0A2I0H235_PUNGR|nr:hypothetical protein CRG98_049951 [Punica granatum]